MKHEDFSNPAGTLVRAGTADGNHWSAFVPSMLPPRVDLDLDLLQVLSKADRAIGELAGVARNVPNPQLLIQPFIRREAVLSSRIEGTQTDVAELYAFEAEQRQPRVRALTGDANEADRQEVYNYVRATEYGLQELRTRPVVSLNFIKGLHEQLMNGVRGGEAAPGEFRRLQNMIGGRPGEPQNARFIPPPATELPSLLDGLEKYINLPDDYPPLIRLAFVHYQFETIHPFRDGNGRIGRLLISLLLVHWNILPHPLLHISAYLERLRTEYCDHLLRVSQRSEWGRWIRFFLEGVHEQAMDASQRVKALLDLQLEWRQRLQKEGVPAIVLGIADRLFESPYTWSSDIQDRFNVSAPTALSSLRRLESIGFVRSVKVGGRSNLFFSDPVIRLVQ